MTMLQQTDQFTHERLMADQQHIAAVRKLLDGKQGITLRGQPRYGFQGRAEPQCIAHKGGRLLSPDIRAHQDAIKRLPHQVRSAKEHLLPPMLGEITIGIATGMRLGFSMAQYP